MCFTLSSIQTREDVAAYAQHLGYVQLRPRYNVYGMNPMEKARYPRRSWDVGFDRIDEALSVLNLQTARKVVRAQGDCLVDCVAYAVWVMVNGTDEKWTTERQYMESTKLRRQTMAHLKAKIKDYAQVMSIGGSC